MPTKSLDVSNIYECTLDEFARCFHCQAPTVKIGHHHTQFVALEDPFDSTAKDLKVEINLCDDCAMQYSIFYETVTMQFINPNRSVIVMKQADKQRLCPGNQDKMSFDIANHATVFAGIYKGRMAAWFDSDDGHKVFGTTASEAIGNLVIIQGRMASDEWEKKH